MKTRTASAGAVVALALIMNASAAWADFVSFNGTGPGGLAANVTFEISGGNLIVTLTNTSSMDVEVPSEILTAVFFSIPGSLTPVSATLASGSVVNNAPAGGAGPGVSGEWSYTSGLNLFSGSNSGISSAGFGVFGENDLFGSPNLDGPLSPNGLQYGITSAGDDPTTGNTPATTTALIQNSVVFVLSGWNSEWTTSDISNIVFQYGTSLGEPNLGAVPEPGVVALLGFGLVALAFGARRLSWA